MAGRRETWREFGVRIARDVRSGRRVSGHINVVVSVNGEKLAEAVSITSRSLASCDPRSGPTPYRTRRL